MQQHSIRIDKELCTGCTACARDCPESNIIMHDNMAILQNPRCLQCGHCVAVCPQAAISMTGFDEPPVAFSRQPALTPEALSLAIQARRSIRQFKTREIPAETIRRIIEAGRFSPTAKNAQDVSYIVLRDKIAHFEKIAVGLFRLIRPVVALFWNVAGQIQIDEHFFFKKAPIAIMVLSKNKVNGTLAAANMALVAESCGLGVLYSGYFTLAANYSRALRQALCLHRKDKVVTTLVLGYPSVHYHRTAQRERANVRYL